MLHPSLPTISIAKLVIHIKNRSFVEDTPTEVHIENEKNLGYLTYITLTTPKSMQNSTNNYFPEDTPLPM